MNAENVKIIRTSRDIARSLVARSTPHEDCLQISASLLLAFAFGEVYGYQSQSSFTETVTIQFSEIEAKLIAHAVELVQAARDNTIQKN